MARTGEVHADHAEVFDSQVPQTGNWTSGLEAEGITSNFNPPEVSFGDVVMQSCGDVLMLLWCGDEVML